jgi:hypothetical protein
MAAIYRIYKQNGNIKFAGTESPSYFDSLKEAVEKCDFDKGEKVWEYSMFTHTPMWEMLVNKEFLNNRY